MKPDDLFWDTYIDTDDKDTDDEYLPCCICSHDMSSECGIGELNYFVTGRHACVCCTTPDEEKSI